MCGAKIALLLGQNPRAPVESNNTTSTMVVKKCAVSSLKKLFCRFCFSDSTGARGFWVFTIRNFGNHRTLIGEVSIDKREFYGFFCNFLRKTARVYGFVQITICIAIEKRYLPFTVISSWFLGVFYRKSTVNNA